MSALPSVGQWVWGEAKTPCKVIDIGTKRSSGQTILKVSHPQGRSVIIPLDKVHGFGDKPPVWAVPSIAHSPEPITVTRPKPLAPGNRVRLKNTSHEFTIIEIHSVRDGSENGEPTFETWARLQTDDGKPAHWKLQQLEVIE